MKLPFKSGQVRITSPYGNRILNGVQDWHNGIDFVSDGSKQIVSVMSGIVLSSRIVTDKTNRTWEWGNYVGIQGDDGKIIYYCHMNARRVNVGQRVKAGDVIGIEGNTGYSFGSHCHFEVREGSTPINAADYLGIENIIQTFPDASIEWREYFAKKVCEKCGLEPQTKKYLDDYKYSLDLWNKLWEQMQ